MFERFSDAARRVVVGAQAEAVAFDHNYIGTEHILLGLLRDGDCTGFRLLRFFDVTLGEIRERVESIIGRGPQPGSPSGHIPFTPRAKKILEMSLREALHMGDNFIGSEHILLGLLREGEGVGAQVLVERGVTLRAVRERLGDVERERPPTGDTSVEMIEVPAEQFSRLVAEVARLRDLLREHGIDPGEELPGFGQE